MKFTISFKKCTFVIHYTTQSMKIEYFEHRPLDIKKGIEHDICFKNTRSFTIIPIFVLLLGRPAAGKCVIASASGCIKKRKAQAKTIPI
jgi:hypothetical protein